MKRAFIIHGYGAAPEEHWFSWLGQQLQAAGVATAIPALPAPEQPDFDYWQAALAANIGRPDAQTVFVAHSLGTISLLHFLSAARPTQIGGIYLVAGFDGRLPGLPVIGDFNVDAYADRARIDHAALRTMSPQIHHVIGDNDRVVAPAASMQLAERLGGAVHRVANGGHFLASDGFHTLPLLWQAMQAGGV
jgi:esterase